MFMVNKASCVFDCEHLVASLKRSLISRLHDQACSTSCYMLAGQASSMFARRLFDVCLMIASCRLCFTHAAYLLDVCSIV